MPDLAHVDLPDHRLEWSAALQPDAHAPASARHRLRALLAAWDLQCLVEDAEIVASELVTNAVRHGDFPAELRVQWQGPTLRVAVADSNDHAPAPRVIGADDPSGRGLQIVDALARDWGVEPAGGGKVVWAELRLR